jgi:hypothetical protein
MFPHKCFENLRAREKPADLFAGGLCIFNKCAVLTFTGLRRHVRRVMMVMVMCEGKHCSVMLANLPLSCQSEKEPRH